MRMGDLDYLNHPKTAGNQNITADTKSRDIPEPLPLTEKQKKRRKWKNWWYYYKWYVICGIILFCIILNVAGSHLGLWTKAPDFQVAYIGKAMLPAETVSALEQLFSSLGSDFNGDGEVIVRINQYIDGLPGTDPDTAYYEYASEISLIGDISDCGSYFFLMEDPARFQKEYQLLASPDGSCPGDTDYSVEDKVILWQDCPLLAGKELGSYCVSILGEESSGSSQELLAGLSLGRRCFFTDDATEYADKCSEVWEMLWKSRNQGTQPRRNHFRLSAVKGEA